MRPLRGIETSLWAPLMDGTYAIVMTLLVLELPVISIDLVHQYNHHEIGIWPLVINLLKLILGYFGVFLIIFDIWVKKRRVLSIIQRYCNLNGLESLALLLSLFIATLLPPVMSLCWKVEQELRIQTIAGDKNINVESAEVIVFHVLFGVGGLLIYVIINLLSRQLYIRLKTRDTAPDLGPSLKEISIALSKLHGVRRDTASRIIASPIILFSWLSPQILMFVYGLIGLWHTDNQRENGIGSNGKG